MGGRGGRRGNESGSETGFRADLLEIHAPFPPNSTRRKENGKGRSEKRKKGGMEQKGKVSAGTVANSRVSFVHLTGAKRKRSKSEFKKGTYEEDKDFIEDLPRRRDHWGGRKKRGEKRRNSGREDFLAEGRSTG